MSKAMDLFIEQVREIVREGGSEEEVTSQVANRLKNVIHEHDLLRPEEMKVKEGSYVLWPVHIEEDGSFSIATAVWDVGQITPIHDHGTWGVIGIYEGVEHEERFCCPEGEQPAKPAPLEFLKEWSAPKGEVFVCCTSDADIHRVSCGSSVPVVGIHVYGADIGILERHSYEAETGEAKTFVSGWG